MSESSRPTKLEFFVDGVPKALDRSRTAFNRRDRRGNLVPLSRPRTYTPEESTRVKALVATCALEARPGGWEPLSGPVRLTVRFFFAPPKGCGDNNWWIRDPDGSNLQKLIEDALEGFAYVNDNQIAEWVGSKTTSSKRTGAHIIVEGL